MRQIVVIAFVMEEPRVVMGSRARIDLGERPRMENVPIPRSCIWVNVGDTSDVEKARQFCDQQSKDAPDAPGRHQVLTYPLTEEEPLEAARRDIMRFYAGASQRA
jgi:hypothetical protein